MNLPAISAHWFTCKRPVADKRMSTLPVLHAPNQGLHSQQNTALQTNTAVDLQPSTTFALSTPACTASLGYNTPCVLHACLLHHRLSHVTELLENNTNSSTAGSTLPAYTLTPEDLTSIVTAAANHAPLHLLGDGWGARIDRAALRMVEAATRVGYMRQVCTYCT
jgi:hypothetical protein